ncbi:hypothetical protein R6Z07F_009293 [Ovis aries]|uniref:Uncharacterized protein n=1 Tax=Ovis aries TaxID=9940 RepID=A0A836A1S1_SHEEP|nr:hypothetical protein JEQ12_019016 [Ovis aries]
MKREELPSGDLPRPSWSLLRHREAESESGGERASLRGRQAFETVHSGGAELRRESAVSLGDPRSLEP